MIETPGQQLSKVSGEAPLFGTEKIPVTVYTDSRMASQAVAREIAELIRTRAAAGQNTILGLATGNTPVGVYAELVRLHKQEGLSFKNVLTFNLDEYWPIQPGELQSYVRFMHENLFDHIDIPAQNIHIPDGTLPKEKIATFCQQYEKMIRDAGGIDLQILGIGRTGHIGFNEPGSPRDCKTRLITLDRITRLDAASDFFGETNVPHKAITMGVDSVMSAKRVILMAWGEGKAPVIKRAVEGEVTSQVAASFLQQHPNARIVLDPAAAHELTRFRAPWLLGPLDDVALKWDETQMYRAVTWLGQHLQKPVLKLTNEDYNEHGLQDLVANRGAAYDINVEVFRKLQSTITGWPGGKPAKSSDTHADVPMFRHANPEIFPKKVVVFSPHPDDDVISMGGTFIRLCDQGHEVHVAYQTSGSIAVWDTAALRHADFVAEYARAFGMDEKTACRIETQLDEFIAKKQPGEVDSPQMLKIKAAIRRTEARAAARFSGVKAENIHFLDLPFYETGRVRKNPIGEKDIQITVDLLQKIQPNQIYAAGDLSDPHGTHRVCLAAIVAALGRLKNEAWLKQCEVWLYRGAWAEWGIEQIEMAVPLSPDEVMRKRTAIFKHESQKDRAVYPGADAREFWQRAEDRNKATAALYDLLGLAEYEAIEGFVRWRES
ncbi:MAG TPA: glucosamine-6-phosphate deaminase [Tepidisphaeraceae bacterium]|jgi:glucosamine-6-phosphate deaminase